MFGSETFHFCVVVSGHPGCPGAVYKTACGRPYPENGIRATLAAENVGCQKCKRTKVWKAAVA